MYTTPSLRRFLSLVLLLAFGLPTAAPAFGLTAEAESTLPACCRRAGEHHCAMSSAEREALTHGTHAGILTSKCPYTPATPTQLQHHDLAFTAKPVTLTNRPTLSLHVAQTSAWVRTAVSGARHKRGPPTVRLS